MQTIRDLSADTLHQTIQEYTTGKVTPIIRKLPNGSWGFRCDGTIGTIFCTYNTVLISAREVRFGPYDFRPTPNHVRKTIRASNKILKEGGCLCKMGAIITNKETMTISLGGEVPATAAVKDLIRAIESIEVLYKQLSKPT